MKKVLFIATFVVLSFSLCLPVNARSNSCGKSNCSKDKGSNGTVYCDTHAAEYAREQGYKVCCVSGCYKRRAKDSSYCSTHICDSKGCTKKATSEDGKYCSTHTPKKVEKKVTKKESATIKKSTKKSNGWEAYDEGYDDIYFDDDYDWDRYYTDDEYANGVDDAMDDLDW